ncbi:unnamed protein product, partial [Adineta steineri]
MQSKNLLAPSRPLSDVTSILTPTNDGQICAVPYKVANFTWDMYFCNRGYCPTVINSNSTCAIGKFGSLQLTDNTIKSFQIKTKSGGINGVNEQCLIYYYYLSNVTNNTITVIKEETNGKNETIDSVTSTAINGWIKRQVPFFALESNYKIFFDIQRRSGTVNPFAGIDELSIYQGNCSEDTLTTELTSMTTIKDTTFTTSMHLETTTAQSTSIIILTSSAPAMTTDNMSETKSSIESTSNTLPTTVISPSMTTASHTTTKTLPTVDSTQEEIHSSTTSQTTLSTRYENSTITIITIASLPPIETTSITITNTLTNNVNPSKETYIIVLSTVIPTVVILLAIGIVWWKKSSSKSIFTRSSR